MMLKTLGAQIKEFKTASILTPICMIGEVVMEMVIPLLMASIIDDGINAEPADMNHVYLIGVLMLLAGLVSLAFGVGGACSEQRRPQALPAI